MKRTLLVALLVSAICGCLLFAAGCGEKQAQKDPNSTDPIDIVIPLTSGYFSDQCTDLPVRVVGNDVTGKQVDEVCYVDSEGKGIKLAPGDYSLAVIASPMTPAGRLFEVPTEAIGITVPQSAEAQGSYTVPEDQAWDLQVMSISGLTEENIDLAYEYAKKSPGQEEMADQYYTLVKDNYDVHASERAEAAAAAAKLNLSDDDE